MFFFSLSIDTLFFSALNWSNEFDQWLNGIEPSIDLHQLTTVRANLRVNHLNYWYENGGVAIMSYDLYKKLANGNGMANAKTKENAFKCLVDPGPDLIGRFSKRKLFF